MKNKKCSMIPPCAQSSTDLQVSSKARPKTLPDPQLGVPVIITQGRRRDISNFPELYRPAKAEYMPCEIKLIPYFAFANRGESDMLVRLSAYNL